MAPWSRATGGGRSGGRRLAERLGPRAGSPRWLFMLTRSEICSPYFLVPLVRPLPAEEKERLSADREHGVRLILAGLEEAPHVAILDFAKVLPGAVVTSDDDLTHKGRERGLLTLELCRQEVADRWALWPFVPFS